jgi:hypothetical protein
MFNVFVFCSGKCGGTTLANTFSKNGYTTTHLHGLKCKGNFNSNIDVNKSIETLDNSCKQYKNVYIIDSYRTPIERKISSFFQHIKTHIPNYTDLSVQEIISWFNNNLLYNIETYESINQILNYYNIPLFDRFNFDKKYNITKKDNKIFIKLLFKDINNWDKILSEIFEKPIIIHNSNLTENKPINDLYVKFKNEYKVPKDYIINYLPKDKEFKIYNTEKNQKAYIEDWLKKSY